MAEYQHKDLAAGRWATMTFAEQMGNIGSEVSRSLKNQNRPERFRGAFTRALELFDLSIEANRGYSGRLKELCRAREEFCDYFMGNSFGTNPVQMQRYYDHFISLNSDHLSPSIHINQ